MDADCAEKPLRQMRKLLKRLPPNPTPEQVHKLRTRARRIEAIASAIHPGGGKTKKLLKLVKPVRKAAGEVRDIDVLTADLLDMKTNSRRGASSRRGSNSQPGAGAQNEPLVRLIEHLAGKRGKSAAKLIQAIGRECKPIRRSLRKFIRLIDALPASERPAKKSMRREALRDYASSDDACSAVDRLLGELARWPRLNEDNLHPFRLKVKELRYVLQLFPDADSQFAKAGFLEVLGKTKDEIGDWHDWRQLLGSAREVLDARDEKKLLDRIDGIVKQKLRQALAGAAALRSKYLVSRPARRGTRHLGES